MTNPILLSSTGPDGFLGGAGIALPTAKLIEGVPTGLDHAYFERESAGLKVGIWRSTAYTEWYDSYPCDEFMYILEGEVTLENETFSQTYSAGNAFLVPKGFCGFWRQPVSMVKYYCIVS